MPTPTSEKRKRGAQPGNLNARTHGLTPRPKPPEYRTEKLTQVDLTAEIHILRQQLVRLNDAALQAASLAETVEIARVIAQTASALSRLSRAQVIVFKTDAPEESEDDILTQSIWQAFKEITEEWGLDDNERLAKPAPTRPAPTISPLASPPSYRSTPAPDDPPPPSC